MRRQFVVIAIALACAAAIPVAGQRGGRGGARQSAAFDLTGYWVSVISEDWKFRMVTPARGNFEAIPYTAEGRGAGQRWDPARDEASGEACRAYGAAGIMRMPGRLHITWENDNTLRIDTDAGTQTRLFRFDQAAAPPNTAATWQGFSAARWETAAGGGRGAAQQARGGSLKVVTTNIKPGYVRRNGAPHSPNAVLTEYYDLNTLPNGDQWLTVTTIVDDPAYFTRPYLTSSDFKKLPDNSGWRPTPCSAK
jgi:hypothetical protein